MSLSISNVSEACGIAKEVLRKWETRYGFPVPERDALGNRRYSTEQLARLKLIKKLIDEGKRPGELVPLDSALLEELAGNVSKPTDQPGGTLLVGVLRERDPEKLHGFLSGELDRIGLHAYVTDLMPGMNQEVGDAWADGRVSVCDEHLYTEAVQRLLREALVREGKPGGEPRVLLTTPSGELHVLGMLMAEVALTLAGAHCICLGPQSPLADMAQAAVDYDARVVGLSFSATFPVRKVHPLLKELRALLPDHIKIWAGGSGAVAAQRLPRGVLLTPTLESAVTALEKLRQAET